MSRKTRLKAATDVFASDIEKRLRMWQATNDGKYIGHLLAPANTMMHTRAVPRADCLVPFQPLALLFVELDPSLKLPKLQCDVAMLALETHGDLQKYSNAKTNSTLLRKILTNFRVIGENPTKRELVLRNATYHERATFTVVCDLVATPNKFKFTSRTHDHPQQWDEHRYNY